MNYGFKFGCSSICMTVLRFENATIHRVAASKISKSRGGRSDTSMQWIVLSDFRWIRDRIRISTSVDQQEMVPHCRDCENNRKAAKPTLANRANQNGHRDSRCQCHCRSKKHEVNIRSHFTIVIPRPISCIAIVLPCFDAGNRAGSPSGGPCRGDDNYERR